MIWPYNKRFAFSIFDGTDKTTFGNVPHQVTASESPKMECKQLKSRILQGGVFKL
jgi:hypothetical protein